MASGLKLTRWALSLPSPYSAGRYSAGDWHKYDAEDNADEARALDGSRTGAWRAWFQRYAGKRLDDQALRTTLPPAWWKP